LWRTRRSFLVMSWRNVATDEWLATIMFHRIWPRSSSAGSFFHADGVLDSRWHLLNNPTLFVSLDSSHQDQDLTTTEPRSESHRRDSSGLGNHAFDQRCNLPNLPINRPAGENCMQIPSFGLRVTRLPHKSRHGVDQVLQHHHSAERMTGSRISSGSWLLEKNKCCLPQQE